MKWNDRQSNRSKRYIDHLYTLTEIQMNRVMEQFSSENIQKCQLIFGAGYFVSYIIFVGWVKVTCEGENELEWLISTCKSVTRDKKLQAVLGK